jgi:hypothetical protein
MRESGSNVPDQREPSSSPARISLEDPLFYRHSNGFRFVVMWDVRETKMIYLSDAPYERVEAEIIENFLKGKGNSRKHFKVNETGL